MTDYFRPAKQFRGPGVGTKGNSVARVSDTPSPFVQKPWNYWVFETSNDVGNNPPGTLKVAVNRIITQIRNKVGLKADTNVRIKVLRTEGWAMAGSQLVLPSLQAQFFDLSPSRAVAQGFARNSQADTGSWDEPAKCGYDFPDVDRRQILTSTTGTANDIVICSYTGMEAGTRVTARVYVLWQSGAF